MILLAVLLFFACAIALLIVPREWAPVPLLVGCCYMTKGQGIELGPASLPIYRMLLAVGVFRVLSRGEQVNGLGNTVDKLVVAWAAWVLLASFFHEFAPGSGPVYAAGVVFDILLIYFLIRAWCRDVTEIGTVLRVVALLLAPIALVMLHEATSGENLFAIFGGVPDESIMREGRWRAQGPFRHPILAGTVGAACVPLFIAIWNSHRAAAFIGIASAIAITIASASSGPIMTLGAGLFAVAMWRFRSLTTLLLVGAALSYLALSLVMSRPPYYLLSKIDITGGSTGWHRAFLIDQTFKHLPEWWLFGTDRTRHWMPNQGKISDYHTDVTNYYIGFGVLGGLLAMLLIIAVLIVSFKWVGTFRRTYEESDPRRSFMGWCFGAALFAHAATSISVAYFDQSMVFFWLTVAVISSAHSTMTRSLFEEASDHEEIDPGPTEWSTHRFPHPN